MKTQTIASFLSCLLCAVAASAQAVRPAQLPPPGTAKITLLADKQEFFLGENILLHYRIENAGKEHLGFDVGGDYRGGTRANRFKVTVVDATGRAIPDPAPAQHEMGGLSPVGSAKPGGEWFESVWLLRYRTLDQPGDYTITVFHDLGWGERQAQDPRVATLKLRLKMPNEAEARQIIAAMDQAKADRGSTWGTKGQPKADFSLLKFPVYRPLLSERADLDGIAGLAEEQTREATAVLLRFAESADHKISCAAAIALSRRIPSPAETNLARRVFLPYHLGGRREPVTNAWDAALASEARRVGLKLVSRANDEALVCGAAMLAGVAEQVDLPAIIAASDAAAQRAHGAATTSKDHHEGPRWACRDATALLGQMARRGLAMPTEPKQAGEFLAFLGATGAQESFRPAGWEKTFAAALEHSHGAVREAAMARLPQPLPEALAALAIARMSDAEPQVRSIACEKVNQLKLPGAGTQALRAVAISDQYWTFWMATEVAVRDGKRVECAELLAKRFAEVASHPQYLGMNFMSQLVGITLGGNMSGSWHFLREPGGQKKANALRDEWLKVIRHHADDLRAGKQLVMGQGMVTAELVPPGVTYQPPHK
ncbi:MAG: hypothetical protein B9S33_07805 [Pedosphaera sp. Tous-C6FEB]|nr:MAG: hypothetical protein B9S33_07805 [Pedosphaera sp. Tous-C6FEB]